MSDNITITENPATGFPIQRTVTMKRRGRPPKKHDGVDHNLLIKDECAAAFREAKAEYEKNLPYKLNNGQFMMVLVHNFQQRQ